MANPPIDYERILQAFVLSNTLRSVMRNTLFYATATSLALVAGDYWPIVGRMAFVLYGAFLAQGMIRHSVPFFLALCVWLSDGTRRDGKVVLALFLQVVETAVLALCFWLLLRRFYPA